MRIESGVSESLVVEPDIRHWVCFWLSVHTLMPDVVAAAATSA